MAGGTNRRSGWICCAVVVGLSGCSPGGGPDRYEIPDDLKQAYLLDCGDYCAAEAACLSVPEDSDCSRTCPRYVDKGAFQAAYLDTRAACVIELASPCDQAGLDGCRDEALQACRPGAGLDAFMESWCRRWLECNHAPVESNLPRCLDEFAAGPDHALFACFSQAAFEQFERCLAETSCDQIVDFPMLTVCREIYL